MNASEHARVGGLGSGQHLVHGRASAPAIAAGPFSPEKIMRSETSVRVVAPSKAPRTVPSVVALVAPLVAPLIALGACSGDFQSNRGLEDMICDDRGCFHCGGGSCVEYRCDETHQCPMSRTCSLDNRCVPDGTPTGARCDSHDDCAIGQICTLDGDCVASPGGGPKGDAGDASDAVDVSEPDSAPGDTGPGEVGLPDHPDDTCRTNADCGADGTCVNGGCYFPCASGGKCPPGQACDAGQCRAAPPENACTFHLECGTAHACLEGTCYERCEETLDCLPHTRCSAGICIADTSPVIQCSGAGSCATGTSCVDGKCVAPCASDGSCAAGYACDLGYCVRAVSCFDQAECGGADCVDGACAE